MAVIRKKPNGKWELDFYSGNTRQRVTFASRREAEEAKRQVVLGLPADDEPKIQAMSLKEGINFYFKTISQAKASSDNEKSYFGRLYKFLRDQGVTLVHEVTPQHLETFKAERAAKFKPSTVNREFNTYRHFFTKAVAWKWINENPSKSVSTIPSARNPRRVWTDEEFDKVLSRIPEWASDVMRAINWLGAGPAELGRVTWEDVDFSKKQILLKRYKGTGEEIRRHMPINPDLEAFLELKFKRARMTGKARGKDRVFLNSRLNPIEARALSSLVRRAVRFHGLPEGTVPYGVRHKFATELLEAGVGEELVRKLMGHRDVRTLIENYAHVRNAALKEAMAVRAEQTTKNTTKKGNGNLGR